MKKATILILCLSFIPLLAQKKDTLNCYTNCEIRIPIAHINVNFVNMKIERSAANTTVSLDTKLHIHKTTSLGLDLGVKTTLNQAFIGEIIDTVYSSGLYKYSRHYQSTNNESQPKSGTFDYFVKVDYPQLASPDIRNERKVVFLGEDFGFSIAANGYDNLSAYRYVVKLDGNAIDTVKGTAIVTLSKYLDTKENAGKKLEVDALYNGRLYKYYDNLDSIKTSQWEFPIVKPNAEWLDQSVGLGQHVIIVDKPTNTATNTFDLNFTLFYWGLDGNKKVLFNPEIKDVEEDQNKFRVNVENGVLSSTVILSVDLNKIPVDEETDLSFSFTANTKFGTTNFKSAKGLKIYRRQ